MSGSYSLKPLWLLLVLVIAYANVWMWTSDSLVVGVPVNLLYHTVLCVAASVAIPLVLRDVWPDEDVEETRDGTQQEDAL